MKHNIYGIAIDAQYPVLCLKMKIDNEKDNIKRLFRDLLNNRFLKVDLDTYYYSRVKTDEIITKINKKHKSSLIQITIFLLEHLGCSDFKVKEGQFGFHLIECNTPFGFRTIRALKFCVLREPGAVFSDSVIGIPLMSAKHPGLLNFKTETGDLSAANEEDFTKHYNVIKSSIFQKFNIMKELGATIEFVNSDPGTY